MQITIREFIKAVKATIEEHETIMSRENAKKHLDTALDLKVQCNNFASSIEFNVKQGLRIKKEKS